MFLSDVIKKIKSFYLYRKHFDVIKLLCRARESSSDEFSNSDSEAQPALKKKKSPLTKKARKESSSSGSSSGSESSSSGSSSSGLIETN